MTTVFSRIIAGELPGTFVHRDEVCVAFMSINPLSAGHVLVVPRAEEDHWVDLPREVVEHLFVVSHGLSRAMLAAFGCTRIGLVVAGFEVPHCHIHLVPTNSMADLDFSRAADSVDRAALEAHARAIADRYVAD